MSFASLPISCHAMQWKPGQTTFTQNATSSMYQVVNNLHLEYLNELFSYFFVILTPTLRFSSARKVFIHLHQSCVRL